MAEIAFSPPSGQFANAPMNVEKLNPHLNPDRGREELEMKMKMHLFRALEWPLWIPDKNRGNKTTLEAINRVNLVVRH